jgi:SAM-dependent methyltransferase
MPETVEIERALCAGSASRGAADWTWREQVKAARLTMDRSWLRTLVRKLSGKRLLDLRREVRRARRLASLPGFLSESHHHAYGRPWSLGRDQFDCLIDRGLKPDHRLLDLGCGSLRTGIWLIPFLDEGSYFGIDSHLESLMAATEYEIPLHRLADKRPRLLHDTNFEIGHFGVEFDWIVAFSVLNHLDASQLEMACCEVSESLAPGGRLILTNRLPMREEEMERRFGLRLVDHGSTSCTLIESRVEWFEFRMVE